MSKKCLKTSSCKAGNEKISFILPRIGLLGLVNNYRLNKRYSNLLQWERYLQAYIAVES